MNSEDPGMSMMETGHYDGRRYNRSRSPVSRPSYRRSRSPVRRYRSRSPPGGYRRYPPRSPPRGDYGRPYPPQQPAFRKFKPAVVERGTDEERSRSTCLFVGNLPYSFVERDVMAMFERFGRIRGISIPIDRYTKRNKGFAFIDFEQRLDAEDAFFKYNGYSLEGRKLRCDWDVGLAKKEHLRPPAHSEYEPRRERERDFESGRYGGGYRRSPSPGKMGGGYRRSPSPPRGRSPPRWD